MLVETTFNMTLEELNEGIDQVKASPGFLEVLEAYDYNVALGASKEEIVAQTFYVGYYAGQQDATKTSPEDLGNQEITPETLRSIKCSQLQETAKKLTPEAKKALIDTVSLITLVEPNSAETMLLGIFSLGVEVGKTQK